MTRRLALLTAELLAASALLLLASSFGTTASYLAGILSVLGIWWLEEWAWEVPR